MLVASMAVILPLIGAPPLAALAPAALLAPVPAVRVPLAPIWKAPACLVGVLLF